MPQTPDTSDSAQATGEDAPYLAKRSCHGSLAQLCLSTEKKTVVSYFISRIGTLSHDCSIPGHLFHRMLVSRFPEPSRSMKSTRCPMLYLLQGAGGGTRNRGTRSIPTASSA